MDREAWNERYRAVPLLWDIDPGPFLGEQLDGVTPGVALDLGAGEGRNSIWLALHGWRVTAVDFASVALERGAALAEAAGVGDSIRWVEEDLTAYCPEPGQALELVLCMFLHLLADERRALLRRTASALRPGGSMLVVGYDTANADRGGEGMRDRARLFTVGDIADDLAGLCAVDGYQLLIDDDVDAIARGVRTAS
ncbi:MAG: SAM-dependent methyltransferase [Acidimicrobiales bacterium]